MTTPTTATSRSPPPPRRAGALPVFTPAVDVSSNELYKQRYALGGDLHLGEHVRLYGELIHGQQTGHNVGPAVPGNQRDQLGLVNGFGELYDRDETTKTGLRAGRQEVFLGNNLQIRATSRPTCRHRCSTVFGSTVTGATRGSMRSPTTSSSSPTARSKTATSPIPICGASTPAIPAEISAGR